MINACHSIRVHCCLWQRLKLAQVSFSILLLVVSLWHAHAIGQEPEVIVETDTRDIYEGESILYRVTVNHVEQPTPPILDGFDDFEIASLGEQSLDSRQVTIINGVRSEVTRRGRQYDYRLTPKRVGPLTVPAPKTTVDGQVILGDEIAIRVTAPESQDNVLLNASADRVSVYPTQSFTLTLTVSVKALPDEFKDEDPVTVQPEPPQLSIPWFVDDQIPEGIEAEREWSEILEPMISRRGHGFKINAIRSASVFSLFDRDSFGFHPSPKRVSRNDSKGVDTPYWDYVFQRTFIPNKIGIYSWGSSTLKGTFGTSVENGKLRGERIYVSVKSPSIEVREVPQKGRPDSFIGAVGTFKLSSELQPTTARVGDPMTLKLSLTGSGSLADARAPDISKLPGIEGRFRTYEATSETRGKTRHFTYSLRPLKAGIRQLPAIPVAYFDTEKESYVTVETAPIDVVINEAETLNDSQIIASPGAASPSAPATQSSDLQVSVGGIFANETNVAKLRNDAVSPRRWLEVWIGMLAFYAVAATLTAKIRGHLADPAGLRRRGAATKAKVALAEAGRLRLANQLREATGQLRCAVVEMIADQLDILSEGLTPGDVDTHLQKVGADEAIRFDMRLFLQACDATRYGAVVEDIASLELQAAALVSRLQEQFEKTRRHSAIGLRLCIGILIALGGCGAAADLEIARQFQSAESQFLRAQSPDDFRRVAIQYGQILDSGFASGAVFYNQGNAWVRAGEWGRAIASYRQAKRFRPRDPYLAANLDSALKSVEGGAVARPTTNLTRYVFIWQDWMSYREKCILVTFLLVVMLAACYAMQFLSRFKLLRSVALVVFAFLILSFGSVVLEWRDIYATEHGVVISGPTVARKGNSETYEPAFNKPLPVGKEFVLTERRGEWIQIEIAGLGKGWVLSRDVAVY